MTDGLRFAVIGAGATGALLAACLAEAGVPVTLIARGDSLEAIRANGIRIIRPDGSESLVRPAALAAPDEPVTPVDVAIFLVKSYDTAHALGLARALIGQSGYVLCLQNGVENERLLAAELGGARVIPGVLYVGAERVAPGVVSCSTTPRVVFGRGDADASAPIDGIEAALTAAGISVEKTADILAAKWQKFIFNCGLNPMTAATGLRLGQILAVADGRELFDGLISEAIAAAAADGAPVDGETHDKVMETGRRMDISSSMAEDLAAGRPLELDAFSGFVRRLGAAHGVPTPVTDVFYRLLHLTNTQHHPS